MGKLWKDVYWLYTADILPCSNGIELYTPMCDLYMWIPCHGHHWYLWEPTWIPVGVPEISRVERTGLHVDVYVCQCVWVWGSTQFFGISIMMTDCCLFGHQVICNYTVHPAVTVAIISGETNDFVKQSWCQYLIKYEHLCINSPPKARMQWFVKKMQSDVSQNC